MLVTATPSPPSALTALVDDETHGLATLRALRIQGPTAVVELELPPEIPLAPVPDAIENAFEHAVGYLEAHAPELSVIELALAHPGEIARPPTPSAPPRPPEPPREPGSGGIAPPLDGQAFVRLPESLTPFGRALQGRTIAISPGHGYIFYESLGRYSTQRGNVKWPGCGTCRGLIEDFGSHALATRHLLPLLEGAGADVILLRERDEQGEAFVVDENQPRFSTSGGTFRPGSASGGHAGGYQAAFDPGAEARWQLIAPGGRSWLSAWFVSGSNRLSNAVLTVSVPGLPSLDLELDQTRAGERWVHIWPLDLPPGTPVEVGLGFPADAAPNQALIADAFRLGGGRHETNHPWWQMGANPFARHQSAPASITGRGDVTTRPAYAELYGADAYVSLHSNAAGRENSTARGSVTYRYSCGAVSDHSNDPAPSVCDDPVGSDRLQTEVHTAMVRSLRSNWDPNWRDRGTKAANFGEVRELARIPGILVETAFHDNVAPVLGARMTDNQALQDPRWRAAAARGIYEGLTRFLVGEDAPLLSDPPTHLIAESLAPGRVRLRFRPATGARAYRVEVLGPEGGFVLGPQVTGSPTVVDLPEGRAAGLRLRSVNEAGLGLPSRTVTAWTGTGPSAVLVVDAFERRDAWVQLEDNRGDTALVHGRALTGTGVGFDSAQESALEDGDLDLSPYRAVVVALGRESTEHGVLTPNLRSRLRSFVETGGAVFLGGTEVGWALDRRGSDESRAFLRDVFGARFVADDASSRQVVGRGPLAGSFGTAPRPLAGAAETAPEAFFTDVLAPEAGFEVALAYGDGAVAGVSGPRTLVVGFALDHLSRASDRSALLGGWATAVLDGLPPVRDLGPRLDTGDAPDAAPDAATPDLPAPDAGAAPDLGVHLISRVAGRAPIEGGCGCQTQGQQARRRAAWLFPTALLGLVILARSASRRRGSRPRPNNALR